MTRVIEVPAHFEDRSFDQFAAAFGAWPPEEKVLIDARGAQWVDPVLVVDVDTHRTARAQRLRQPSYQGLRRDLTPDDL